MLIGVDGMLGDAERGTDFIEALRRLPLAEFETAISDLTRGLLDTPLWTSMARLLVAVGHRRVAQPILRAGVHPGRPVRTSRR